MSIRLKLACWTLLASIANFLCSFLLASIYSVSSFGFYAQLLSVATLISFIFTLRADLYSVEENTFNELFVISNVVFVSILSLSLLFDNGYIVVIWAYGISQFSLSTYKAINDGRHLVIGYFRIVNVLVIVLLQFIFLYAYKLDVKGLCYGASIGSFFVSITYSYICGFEFKVSTDRLCLLRRNVKKYIIGTISWVLDNLIIFTVPVYSFILFSAEQLGPFNFAERFFKAPVGILVSSVVPFFISMSSNNNIQRNGVLKRWMVICVSFIPIIFFFPLFYPSVVKYLWGEKWVGSSLYVMPLSIFYLFYIMTTSTSYVYVKSNKYTLYVFIQLGIVLSTCLVYYTKGGDLINFYKNFVCVYVLFQITNLFIQYWIVGKNDKAL